MRSCWRTGFVGIDGARATNDVHEMRLCEHEYRRLAIRRWAADLPEVS